MCPPLANFANDLREVRGDFPSRLILNGRHFTVVASEIEQPSSMDAEGVYAPKSFDVIGVLSEFGNVRPAIRQQITLDGQTVRVDAVHEDAQTDSIRLEVSRS